MNEEKKKDEACGCGSSCNCRSGCGCRATKLLIALLLLVIGSLSGYFIGRFSPFGCQGMGEAMCSHMPNATPEPTEKN